MIRTLSAGLLAAAVAITGLAFFTPQIDTAQAQAANLSGKKGKVKRRLPRGHGDCPEAVEEYINASGHSAYASTAYDFSSGRGYICAVVINRKSTEEAEALALRSCEAGTKKWNRAYSGKCEIFASK